MQIFLFIIALFACDNLWADRPESIVIVTYKVAGATPVTSQKLMAQGIECLRKLRLSIPCAMSFEKEFFI
jgi:hypothetical protein